MLNPIALLLTGYLRDPRPQGAGTDQQAARRPGCGALPQFSLYSQLNAGIFLALACCVSRGGLQCANRARLRVEDDGPQPASSPITAASTSAATRSAVMLTSGAIAGLAGAEQVLGVYGAFYDNFSPGYGFDGIAVAMLANFNPIGVVLSAFLFGALNSGSSVLQMTTGVSKYLVQVLQFLDRADPGGAVHLHWLRARADARPRPPRRRHLHEPAANPSPPRRRERWTAQIAFSASPHRDAADLRRAGRLSLIRLASSTLRSTAS